MEYGLGHQKEERQPKRGLNPCFNGIWSRTGIHGNLVEVLTQAS